LLSIFNRKVESMMNNQDTASKVIDRLSARIAGLTRENTILSVMVEELQAEVKRLTEEKKPD